MANFKTKNICDKGMKIYNLHWQFSCIFRWLRHGIHHFFWRCYLHGEIFKTKLPVLRFLKIILKTPTLWGKIHPLECVLKISFGSYLVAFSVSYVVVYSDFSVGFVFVEQFAKQNSHFSEFLQIIVWGHVLGEDKFLANTQKTDNFVS